MLERSTKNAASLQLLRTSFVGEYLGLVLLANILRSASAFLLKSDLTVDGAVGR
jgi:hypothetical protein